MSYANNSRNVADILRHQQLEPINPQKRGLPGILPATNAPQPPSRERPDIRTEIPI